VFLPRTAPWLADYVTELTGFPGTKYDDQVDSTTQALSHLNVPAKLRRGILFSRGAAVTLRTD
jgi:phage terminase large subunit-like protein